MANFLIMKKLQLYLTLGLKPEKILRILEFNQSQWLKPYIERKALYKLMNNAIYGKTLKNLRNRINVKLANNGKDYLKCTSKPSYMLHEIFDNNLVAIRKSIGALKL